MIYKIKYLFIFLLCFLSFSCVTTKVQQGKKQINKFTFSVQTTFGDLKVHAEQIKSLLDKLDPKLNSDSIDFSQVLKKKIENDTKFPNEIYIEITNNGTIKQRFYANRLSHFIKYVESKDSIIMMDYQTKEIMASTKLEREGCSYNIELDKAKTKMIKGYLCYFVRIEEFSNNEEYNKVFGSDVYEMYVTDEIKIPMYSLVKNSCYIAGIYPLEVKRYFSKYNEITSYTLIKCN